MNYIPNTEDWKSQKRQETLQNALAGPPIPNGFRNDTLTKVAGRLHDGTRTLEELTQDLHEVNEARCEHDGYRQQLSRQEVAWIAKSIHQKPACRPSKGKPCGEVLDFVERHWIGVVSAEPWKGQAGGSNYKVYEALLEVVEQHGWLSESGNVCVSVSTRNLAMLAGVSNPTCIAALGRLQNQRLLYRVPMPTKGTAGRLILRDVCEASPTDLTSQSNTVTATLSGKDLSEILTALKRFRTGAGRITPTMLRYARLLMFYGQGATVAWLSRTLERRPDNVRRSLRALKERGIVEETERDTYCVVPDLLPKLEMALIEDRIPDTERAQRLRNESDREAYEYHKGQSHKARMESIRAECEDRVAAHPEPELASLPAEIAAPLSW